MAAEPLDPQFFDTPRRGQRHRAVQFQRAALQNAESFGALLGENGGAPGLEDARLLRRDRFDARSEKRLMIEGGITAISGSTTLVASGSPPSPVSSTTTSTDALPECDECHRRHSLEKAGMRVYLFAGEQNFGRGA